MHRLRWQFDSLNDDGVNLHDLILDCQCYDNHKYQMEKNRDQPGSNYLALPLLGGELIKETATPFVGAIRNNMFDLNVRSERSTKISARRIFALRSR
jgi:hypothetical protein